MACWCFRRGIPAPRNARTVATEDDMAEAYFRHRTLESVMAYRRFRRCILAPRYTRTVVTEDDMGEVDSFRRLGTKIGGILVVH